jgi:glycosyltransferase involved in cell wall biosynthesis
MVVNIIMPVYNTCVTFLQEAIESIKSQSLKSWTLIIVDDASNNPDTIKYLKNIKDEKIRVLFSPKNLGDITNRIYAKDSLDFDCKYIAFMDSDDIMLPERLEKQFNFLLKNEDVDILGCQIQFFCAKSDIKHAVNPKESLIYHHFNVNDFIFTTNWCINNPTTMMKKEILQRFDCNIIGHFQKSFNLHKNKFPDFIFYSILAKAGYQIRNLDEILLMYRITSTQTSRVTKIGDADNEEAYEMACVRRVHKGLRKKILQDKDIYLSLMQKDEFKYVPEYRQNLVCTAGYFDSARKYFGKYVIDLLKPEYKVLDLGCGVLRVGLPIIKYLDVNNYYGFDISEHRLIEAKQEVSDNNLLFKNPKLTNKWSDINLKFDFILCFQVFIHLDDEILDDVLDKISSSLKDDGVCIASINTSDKNEDNARWLEFPFVCRPYSFYDYHLRKHGLKFEKVTNFGDTSPENHVDRLMKITRI